MIEYIIKIVGGEKMKDYKIAYINHEEYEVIIFSESYKQPLSNLYEIELELKKMKLKNKMILFDMILCRGNNEDRFIECLFDGENFVTSTIASVKVDKKNILRKLSTQYLLKNREVIEHSILTSIQKKMLLKGIAI